MPIALRVLLIEDSESDADLMLRQLKKAGYDVEFERVEGVAEMQAALASKTWDLVISDYSLPKFNAPAALKTLRSLQPDLPFITVSGTIGEETAAALMKAGANNYLMKDNLFQLGTMVEHELADGQRRLEYRRSTEMIRENEARYRILFENSPISLWEEDYSGVKFYIDQLRAGGISDFKAYFESHPDEIQNCAHMVKVLDVNQTTLTLFNAKSKEELLANMDVIIPQDLEESYLTDLLFIAEGRSTFEYETYNYTLDGKQIDINIRWAVVSGHEQDLSRVILSVIDISQRKATERQLQQTETRLRSLVERMPAIVYTELQDEPGRVIYVSPQIEALTGYTAENWVGTPNFIQNVIHPDDLANYQAQNIETFRTGEPFRVEYRICKRNGDEAWVRDEAVLIRDENGKGLFWQGVMHDITESKRAEIALRESESRFRGFFEQDLIGVTLTGLDKRWLDANPAMCNMLGYSKEELLQKSWAELTYPADLDKDVKYFEAVLRGEITGYRMEKRFVRKDGRLIYTDLGVRFYRKADGNADYFMAMLSDITERKQGEAEIERHAAELEVLYQNSLAINRLIDPQQIARHVIEILEKVLNWHHVFIRLFNSQTGELELLDYDRVDLIPEETQAEKEHLRAVINNKKQGLSGWVYENGEVVRCPRVWEDSRYLDTFPGICSGIYVPLRTGEHTIGSISVESEIEDAFSEHDERLLVTLANQAAISIENAQLFMMAQVELAARKQAEAQLMQAQTRLEQRVAERTAELKAANLALEKAARTKDEFLASMSHELRTPLTGILGLSEVLQLQTYGDLSEKQLTAMKHISASGRHLLDMINDILDLTRIEASQLVLRSGPCLVSQVCQSSLKAIANQAQQKNLHTHFTIEPVSITIQADGQRLKQMLANLLNNAIKFTPPGGAIGIDVAGSPEENLVRITVWDTGIGIRAEDMPRLFQTFVQLDASLSRQYNGTGLGLALVKRLAELQGGSVSVESVFGVGSRFTVSLPWIVSPNRI